MLSHCIADGWGTPVDASFAGDGVEANPFVTSDGKHLYFISTRSTDGQKHKDVDIWEVDRGDEGSWGEPRRLPPPVNSRSQEWFPRPAADGWLYFGSGRPGGFGKTDIWRARKDRPGHWQVENLGKAINTPGDEYEPLPSPDGQRLIVMADGGLYQSERQENGWSERRRAGGERQRQRNRRGILAKRKIPAVLARHKGAALRRVLRLAAGRCRSVAAGVPVRGSPVHGYASYLKCDSCLRRNDKNKRNWHIRPSAHQPTIVIPAKAGIAFQRGAGHHP